jgi:hypothetical protein
MPLRCKIRIPLISYYTFCLQHWPFFSNSFSLPSPSKTVALENKEHPHLTLEKLSIQFVLLNSCNHIPEKYFSIDRTHMMSRECQFKSMLTLRSHKVIEYARNRTSSKIDTVEPCICHSISTLLMLHGSSG